jgi:sec-independent protein translocase protein TatB
MFDIGFSELVLLALVGLLVLGPKRWHTVAAQAGKWLGTARRTTTQLYRQLERETRVDEPVERRRPNLRVVPRAPSDQPPP